jgi:hypothetical protein
VKQICLRIKQAPHELDQECMRAALSPYFQQGSFDPARTTVCMHPLLCSLAALARCRCSAFWPGIVPM